MSQGSGLGVNGFTIPWSILILVGSLIATNAVAYYRLNALEDIVKQRTHDRWTKKDQIDFCEKLELLSEGVTCPEIRHRINGR